MRGAGRASVLTLAVLVAAASAAPAQVSVRADLAPQIVRVGEGATLAVVVEGAQSVPVPTIPGGDGIQVRYVGPSTQISIVNGRSSASVTHHFTVIASRPGHFRLGPIVVEYGGQRYEAGTRTLEVVPAGAASGGAAPGGAAGAAPGAAPGTTGPQRLRLELLAPKTTAYLHELLPLRVRLAVERNVRVADVQYPTLPGEGFALERFPEPSQRQEQGPDGVYAVADFATTLTPLRTGTLTVGPARLDLTVIAPSARGRDSFFEQFFGGDPFGSRRPLTLESQPLALTVLPLPEQGRPADFSGAVGSFTFDVTVAPRELAAGDPVTVTSKIQGSGNLDGVTAPVVAGSDELRAYPVQQTAAPPSQQPARAPEKAFEQVLIPQRPGALTIPEIRFSYFDPTAGVYRTLTHPPITLAVRPAAGAAQPPRVVGAPIEAPEPETLGRDIVSIKDAPGRLVRRGSRLHRNRLFWAAQLLPLLAWLTVGMYDRRRRRLHGDAGYARFTRAGAEARRALDTAREALRAGRSEAFYDAIARAMTGYLSAKLDLPPGTVTAEVVAARLRARGVAASVTEELGSLLTACEHVRFAPTAGGDGGMERTLERATAIVRGLERERRLTPGSAATAVAILSLATALLTAASGSAAPGESASPPAVGGGTQGTAENPAAAFFRAGALYGEGRYAEAAGEYERILAAGWESGPLYFNLGNAYFRSGEGGRAVLEYERAATLLPRDPDVHANLAFARESTGNEDETPVLTRLLFPLARSLTSAELLLGTSAAYGLLMAALVLARLMPRLASPSRRAAVALGVALVVLGSSAAFRLVTCDLPRRAVVVARQDTAVRFEPSDTGTEHFRVHPGGMLRVLAEREGWTQVARADGARGWIETAAVEELFPRASG